MSTMKYVTDEESRPTDDTVVYEGGRFHAHKRAMNVIMGSTIYIPKLSSYSTLSSRHSTTCFTLNSAALSRFNQVELQLQISYQRIRPSTHSKPPSTKNQSSKCCILIDPDADRNLPLPLFEVLSSQC
jgi:hypothetical protein